MALYSHSRLTGYRHCPRKFLWRYVWNVDPSVEGVEAFTGKRVHEALEDLYAAVLRGSEPPTLPQVLDRFHDGWDRAWTDEVRIVADQPVEHYRRTGRRCLEGYYERHHPFQAGTTLAVERAFEVPLEGDGGHRIRGFFDRVDIGADGAIEIHDYKTGKRTASQRDLEGDLQVGLYEMAARHLYPEGRNVRMIWHYLRSGVERQVPARGPERLLALRRSTRRQIGDIEERITAYRGSLDTPALTALATANRGGRLPSVPLAARAESNLFPVRTGPLCRWCSFLAWCPEGSRHAGLAFQPPAPPPDRPHPRSSVTDPRQARLF